MFSNEKKTDKPGKTPDNYKKQINNKLDSAFEGLDIFSDQQEDGVIFKKGYPVAHPVADCDNDTTIPTPQHFAALNPKLPSTASYNTITTTAASVSTATTTSVTTTTVTTGVGAGATATTIPSTSTKIISYNTITTTAASVSTATTTSVTTTTVTTGVGAGATATTIPSTSTKSSGRTVQSYMNNFNMSSIWKIGKFKGDNTQNPETWLTYFNQYCSFYDLSKKKSAQSFPFHLEGHAKIWYDTVSDSKKQHIDFLIAAFKDRFKDKQHLLDITILQTHDGRNESVLD
ncbi:unnamed protein product [Mytilus coruscus]|uniref:Retrotransposon gag domain-containing protein n=1 Tax=Mytilus coruscus TaxID=42192 RepID=A0A6J8CJM2_MYTCO|nr:unnamed protein product [Mytilus coruscus]